MAGKIRAISQRASLIKRLNVYFGSEEGDENYPFSTQKTVLVREFIDNAVDILRKNRSNKLLKKANIRVVFHEDGSVEVYDSGTGIPTGLSKTAEGTPASEMYLALGVLNAGDNYEDVSDTLGTNGVGGSGGQMLSEYLLATVYKDGKEYHLDFKDGVPGAFNEKGEFKKAKDYTCLEVKKDKRSADEKKKFPTGTKIVFKINDNLFKSSYPYDRNELILGIKGTSFLEDFINFEVIDNQAESRQEYHFKLGGGVTHIVDLGTTNRLTGIHYLSNSSSFEDDTVDITNGENVKVKKITKQTKIEVAFAYRNDYEYVRDSYVNTIRTKRHGIHVLAFEKAFTDVFNEKLKSMKGGLSKNEKEVPTFADYAEGLSLAVSVSLPEPDFNGQTKAELLGKKALKEFVSLLTDSITKWVNDRKNQNDIKIIADKVLAAYKLRLKRKEEIDLKREKNKVERNSVMPARLVDCENTYDELSEIYFVEGDSAGTPIKACRNSAYQAVLPLRGKILNVLKASYKKMLQDEVIQSIIKCMDSGFGKDYVHEKARYRKLIIATDADADGDAIADLLVVMFWVLFPDAILNGYVYRVLTPLYIIKTKNKNYYCLNAKERDEVVEKLNADGVKYEIVRAKGLGEAGKDALIETGMDPKTRRIQRIVVDDIEKAKAMLDVVMGTDTEPRKKWLSENHVGIEIAE